MRLRRAIIRCPGGQAGSRPEGKNGRHIRRNSRTAVIATINNPAYASEWLRNATKEPSTGTTTARSPRGPDHARDMVGERQGTVRRLGRAGADAGAGLHDRHDDRRPA